MKVRMLYATEGAFPSPMGSPVVPVAPPPPSGIPTSPPVPTPPAPIAPNTTGAPDDPYKFSRADLDGLASGRTTLFKLAQEKNLLNGANGTTTTTPVDAAVVPVVPVPAAEVPVLPTALPMAPVFDIDSMIQTAWASGNKAEAYRLMDIAKGTVQPAPVQPQFQQPVAQQQPPAQPAAPAEPQPTLADVKNAIVDRLTGEFNKLNMQVVLNDDGQPIWDEATGDVKRVVPPLTPAAKWQLERMADLELSQLQQRVEHENIMREREEWRAQQQKDTQARNIQQAQQTIRQSATQFIAQNIPGGVTKREDGAAIVNPIAVDHFLQCATEVTQRIVGNPQQLAYMNSLPNDAARQTKIFELAKQYSIEKARALAAYSGQNMSAAPSVVAPAAPQGQTLPAAPPVSPAPPPAPAVPPSLGPNVPLSALGTAPGKDLPSQPSTPTQVPRELRGSSHALKAMVNASNVSSMVDQR